MSTPNQPHVDAASEGCPNGPRIPRQPLSGRCECPASGEHSRNGRCTRTGALREQMVFNSTARSMICDHHAALLETAGAALRTVQSNELE